MSTPGAVRIVAPLAGVDPGAVDGDGLIYDGGTGTWVRDPNTRVALADVQERVDALEAEAGGALKAFVQTTRTGVTFGPCHTSGSWTMCPTAYRVTGPAAVGDLVQWIPNVMVLVGSDSEHDLAAVVSGSPVRYASTGTSTQHPNGMARMYLGSTGYARSWPVITWQVQSGDLDTDGNLTLAVMYRSNVSGNTVGSAAYANSTVTFLNWGPVTLPGDDLTGRVLALEDALGAAGGIATLDGSSLVPIGQLPVGSTAGTVAAGDDSRLSNARTPTAHATSHGSGGSDPVTPAAIGALATAARGAAGGVASLDGSTLVPVAQLPVGTSSGTVAAGDDARLTNSRTPTAHAASHATGGSDPVSPASIGALATSARGIAGGVAPLDSGVLVPIAYLPTGSTSSTVVVGNDARLSDARTPTAHATSHGSGGSDPVTPAAIGALATTARGAASGVASLDSGTKVPVAQLPVGTTAGTVAAGDDSRMTNARTPTAHASSHASGGSDPVTVAQLVGGSPGASDVLNYSGGAWVPSARLTTAETALTALQSTAPPQTTDTLMYGDVVSSVQRYRTTNSTELSNGFYTLSVLIVPRTISGLTKVRFFITGAGTAGAGTAVGLGIYTGSNPAALTRVATAPVVQSTFTSTGLKELTLSASVTVTAGQRVAWMSYIPASGFAPSPGLGCTQVTYAALINPGVVYSGYKAAAVAPPSTLDVTTGFTSDTNLPWWSLL